MCRLLWMEVKAVRQAFRTPTDMLSRQTVAEPEARSRLGGAGSS